MILRSVIFHLAFFAEHMWTTWLQFL